MADRNVRIITKQTAVPGRIPTGTTGFEDNFIRQGELGQNTADNKLFGFDGSNIFEFGINSFLYLTGGTISGNLLVGNLSASTILSAGTDLYSIFQLIGANSAVGNGTNTYTGGTNVLTTVNVSALTISTLAVSGTSKLSSTTATSLSSTTISGGTIFSGSTNLYSIFAPLGLEVTAIQPGSNITTGGTATQPTINLAASPSINGLTFSGTATGSALSATAVSASTIFSGSTDLNTYFNQDRAQINTKANISGETFTGAVIAPSLSATTLSGGTIFSGSTDLNTYFNQDRAQINTKANISGATFTGTVLVPSLSSTTISGGTIFSGSTNLYSIFAPLGLEVVAVQPGSNITTGGTATQPTINLIASPSVNNITFSGTATGNALSATTVSGGTIFSGSTDLNTYFNQDRDQINTKANISGVTFTGGVIVPNLSATTVSGGTIFSGSTNLYSIFAPLGLEVTAVRPGSNITTGGTATQPTINLIDSPSVNNITFSGTAIGSALSATTLSGGTMFSGSTNLYSIFAPLGLEVIAVQPGSNITTGGTATQPTINLIASPSLSNIFSSGSSQMNLVSAISLSAGTFSGGTILSGGTNLYSIFAQLGGEVTSVQPGSNITTGGTATNPIISLAASPSLNNIFSSGSSQMNLVSTVSMSAGTLSGGTILSGGTNLYSIFAQLGGEVTSVQPGSNITTGGTATNPIVSLATSPSINNLIASGSSQLAAVTATSLSAGTLSGGTILSGGTNLYSIFSQLGGEVTSVQPGSNITTGGTATNPIISLAASPSLNNIFSSGSSQMNLVSTVSMSAGTLSGGTILSGGTNLYSIFAQLGGEVTSVQPGSNITTGGTATNPIVSLATSPSINNLIASGSSQLAAVTATSLSAGTLSGGTITSGSTNLYNIFAPLGGEVIFVSNGTNTYTGGTNTNPTINVSALTINTLVASGNSQLAAVTATSLSAGTLSGGTILSGGTNLYSIFSQLGGEVTSVQPGSNITTGGTATQPTINLTDSPSLNNIFSSGSSQLNTVTAVSLSAGTLSASTLNYNNNPVAGYVMTSDGGGNITLQLPPTAGVQAFFFYGNEQPSDIGGYDYMLTTASVATAQTITTASIASGTVIANFITLSGNPGITFIPPGVITTYITATKTTGGGNTQIVGKIYKRSTGGTETLLATTALSSLLTANVPIAYVLQAALPTQVTLLTSDRIVTKFFLVQSAGNVVVQLTVEDSTAGRTELPSATVDGTLYIPYTGATGNVYLGTNSIDAENITSGGTNLNLIFLSTATTFTNTAVKAGSNITTGGTATNPIVSLVASPSVNLFTASGSSLFSAGLTATTISANTLITINTFVGANGVVPTAKLHLYSGSTGSTTAPLKFTSSSGTVMTTPEIGAVEYDGSQLYLTPSSSTRNILIQLSGTTLLTNGLIPFANTNGYLTSNANLNFISGVLNLPGGASTAINSTGANGISLNTNSINRFNVNTNGEISNSNHHAGSSTTTLFTLTQAAFTGGVPIVAQFNGGAHTTLTTGTELNDVIFSLNRTVQHTGGNIINQRSILIQTPTHSFTSASTITNASSLSIIGPPSAGTNSTIINSSALYISQGSVGSGTTNSFGIICNASTGGTNNYSAQFLGGPIILTSGSTISSSINGAVWNDGTYFNFNPGIQTSGTCNLSSVTATTISATKVSATTAVYTTQLQSTSELQVLNGGSSQNLGVGGLEIASSYGNTIPASGLYVQGQSKFVSSTYNVVSSGTSNSAQTINWVTSNNFDYTLSANTIFTFSNTINGQTTIVASRQPINNSGLTTSFTAGTTTIKWQGGNTPVQTPTSGATDIYTFIQSNGVIYGVVSPNF